MKQYVCSVCGYVYDEANGIPEAGINPGTLWMELPTDWKCPWCGAGKDDFKEKGAEAVKPDTTAVSAAESEPHVERELSAMEMSIICSNLARGCEKQYLTRQSEEFIRLADFFKVKAEPIKNADIEALMGLFEKDLKTGFEYANTAATEYADRGAKRSLLWAEKITRILKSLLKRFEKEGNAMLENTGVFVCTACGFVYVGDAPPEICPVCKVPSWKFEKMEGRAR